MKDSYLIQRLEAPYSSQLFESLRFGGGLRNGGLSAQAMDFLRPIFAFEYMGSAEFEWGAVPNALDRMVRGPLATGAISFHEEGVQRAKWRRDGLLRIATVYVLAPAGIARDAEQRIRELARDEAAFRLKETACFAAALRRPEGQDYPRTLGWLELDNGFMWFADREMWAKTCELFGVEIDETDGGEKG